jgi:hypothetical protein
MPVLSNSRHERFAQSLVTGKSATEAYKEAGYKGDRTAASRLSTKFNIQARVKELQTEAARNTNITIASLIRESEEVRELAVAAGQLSAANAAIVNKAKLSGLWVDRRAAKSAIQRDFNSWRRSAVEHHQDNSWRS